MNIPGFKITENATIALEFEKLPREEIILEIAMGKYVYKLTCVIVAVSKLTLPRKPRKKR